MADNLSAVRAQGRDAKKINETDGDVLFGTMSAHSCPYGPGDARDAWLAGFGGAPETIEQVDSSTATTDDVRELTPETVRAPKTPKTKGAKKDATTVKTVLTGTGETSLQTKVEQTNPELADRAPQPETVLGDPAASTAPGQGVDISDTKG